MPLRTFLLNTLCTLALICVTALPFSSTAYFPYTTAHSSEESVFSPQDGFFATSSVTGLLEWYSYDTVTVPRYWQSAPNHPITTLSYITEEEMKLLKKLDLHNSGVDVENHYGPEGVPSLNGGGSAPGSDIGGGGSSGGSRAEGNASDRNSVSGYSGGGSSGGSRAEGNAADRNSVSGYSGGGGNNNNNNSRADGNAADRNSVSGYSGGGSSGGSRAEGNAADRNSVSGYAGGGGNQSPIDKIGAGLRAGVDAARNMTRATINNVVDTAKTVVGKITDIRFATLPSITAPKPTQPSTQPITQTPTAKPAEVPDQIKEQLAKMRGTTDVSPEEAREYEQMDLDAAKRGFQKELADRAAGSYSPDGDANNDEQQGLGDGPEGVAGRKSMDGRGPMSNNQTGNGQEPSSPDGDANNNAQQGLGDGPEGVAQKPISDRVTGSLTDDDIKPQNIGFNAPEVKTVPTANPTSPQETYNPNDTFNKLTGQEARMGGNPTAPQYGPETAYKPEPVDIQKVQQLNAVDVPKPTVDINGRRIEPFKITGQLMRQVDINTHPALSRDEYEQKIGSYDPTKDEQYKISGMVSNQMDVENYNAAVAGKKEPYNIANPTTKQFTDIVVKMAQKVTTFNPQKIGSTNITDTDYTGDPRNYKITGPMELPGLGDMDRVIGSVPAATDTADERKDLIMKQLVEVYGVPKNIAAGITGNIAVEAYRSWVKGAQKFDPTATDGLQEGSLGLFQHRLERLVGMKQFSATQQPGLNAQVSYALAEMNGTSPVADAGAKRAGDAFRANPNMSVEEATKTFQNNFERPKSKTQSLTERTTEAQAALKSYEQGGTQIAGSNDPAKVQTNTGKRTVSERINDALEAADPKNPIEKAIKGALQNSTTLKTVVKGMDVLEKGADIMKSLLGGVGINIGGLGGDKNTLTEAEQKGKGGTAPVGSDPALGTGSQTPGTTNGNTSSSKNNGVEGTRFIEDGALDATKRTLSQNAEAVLKLVSSTNIQGLSPVSFDRAKEPTLITRATITVDSTTYTIDYKADSTNSLTTPSRETGSILIKASRTQDDKRVEFTYSDRQIDGSLDSFNANNVSFEGASITTDVKERFTEELRTLAQVYYNAQ